MKPAPADALAELQRITAALSGAASAEQVGRVVTELARDAIGAASASLWVLDGAALVLVAHAGNPPEYVRQFSRIPLASPLPGASIVASRQPRWVESEDSFVRVSPDIAAKARAAGQLKAYASLPLVVGDRTVGIVAWGYAGWRRFEPDEKLFIQTVASHCAQAIDRARLFEQVRATEERLRLALDSARIGTWDSDLRAKTVRFDARCKELLDIGPDEETGWGERLRRAFPGDLDAIRAAIARSEDPTGDGALAFEFRTVHSGDDAVRWLSLRGRTTFEDGVPVRRSGTVIDVTEAKHAEAERAELLVRERAARAEAERANRMKDEFLAVVSHELRTPLNAILGWVNMLGNGSLRPERRTHALEVIERNARMQEQLITDLLDMSRITSGKLHLAATQVDLRTVVAMALDAVRPAAATKGVRLDTSLGDDASPVVGDARRLQQVAWNLLTNAVKFTPPGGVVTVSLAREGRQVALRVADTGQGIDADFLPQLFQPFRQGDASAARKAGGLGLGLAISRTLVAMHGGTITASSDGVGHGTEMSVRLPLAAGDGDAAATQEPASEAAPATERRAPTLLQGADILVIEDDEDARELLTELLEGHGARVRSASTAAEGFERLVAALPALLVSDVGLPGEDGLSLIRRVRAVPGSRHVPAIALTAFTRREDREHALEAGFDVYLPKPVDVAALIDAAARLVASPR